MLKRVVLIVTIIVLAKPIYDIGTDIYKEVKLLIEEPKEEVIDVNEVESPQQELIQTSVDSTSVTIKNEKVSLPKVVKNTKDLTQAFYYYFSNWQNDFEIKYVGSTSDIENIIVKAINDASNKNEYIKGHLSTREIQYEYTKMEAKIKVHQEYLTNKTQEAYVNQKVAEILSTVKSNKMNEYEKVKFVNDFIVKNTVYGSDTKSASPHSAYAILKEGKGVCQGYALLALKMLQNLGVEARYVTGEVNTGGHAWNLVKVNGEWYHLDVTWNDPVPDRQNIVSYKYFLINDSQIRKDHIWEQGDFPKATSGKYAFMKKIDQGVQLDNYLYYSNEEDDHRLYRVNVETGESQRLSNNRAQYIVGFDDWIYYSNYSHGAYLAKIKSDGTEETIIYREEVKDLFIDNGYLYFTSPNGKKKIEL